VVGGRLSGEPHVSEVTTTTFPAVVRQLTKTSDICQFDIRLTDMQVRRHTAWLCVPVCHHTAWLHVRSMCYVILDCPTVIKCSFRMLQYC